MSYFKRKRLGITDYKKRLSLLLSNKPRLVIRKSLKHINVQIIEYKEPPHYEPKTTNIDPDQQEQERRRRSAKLRKAIDDLLGED